MRVLHGHVVIVAPSENFERQMGVHNRRLDHRRSRLNVDFDKEYQRSRRLAARQSARNRVETRRQ